MNSHRLSATNGRRLTMPQPPAEHDEWTPDSARKFAAKLSDDFLACRELGHNWKSWTARWIPSQSVFERALRCQRCRSVRRQILTASGHVVSNNYEHADGYLVQGHGRMTGNVRDQLRLESITRVID